MEQILKVIKKVVYGAVNIKLVDDSIEFTYMAKRYVYTDDNQVYVLEDATMCRTKRSNALQMIINDAVSQLAM